jgi:hypothetical protein
VGRASVNDRFAPILLQKSKIEQTLKISPKLIFGLLCCCFNEAVCDRGESDAGLTLRLLEGCGGWRLLADIVAKVFLG